jgi:DNA-binding response OmpR family regulator
VAARDVAGLTFAGIMNMSPLPTSQTGPRRILVVEDNAEGRRALQRILELHGLEVTAVGDGASALEALLADPPPDAVLLDLILPDIDGSELARHACTVTPRPYVAMITGWTIEVDVEELMATGLDDMFQKPLDVDALMAKLRARWARSS